METEIKNTWSSDDVLLTSFLLVSGVRLVEVVEDFPRHFRFVLTDPEECNRLKIAYFNNAQASARDLFSQRELLISEIKNRSRREGRYE